MQGTVIKFVVAEDIGYILGQNGNRYFFSGKEWKATVPPWKHAKVHFNLAATGRWVIGVMLMPGEEPAEKDEKEAQLDPQHVLEAEYSIGDWYIHFLENCTNLNGRARRKEFWCALLLNVMMLSLLVLIETFLHSGYIVSSLFCIFTIISGTILLYRRLHDANISDIWLSLFIMLAGVWFVLALVGIVIFMNDVKGTLVFWEKYISIIFLFFSPAYFILFPVYCIIGGTRDTSYQENEWGMPAKPFQSRKK